MQVCPNCQSTVAEGAKFCTKCGTRMEVHQTDTPVKPTAGRMHCPNCKSTHFTPIVESSVNGAMTTSSRNGRMSHTTMTNTHRNYWMCSDCGTKFRNIQNLEEEIALESKKPKVYTICTIIFAILALYLIIEIARNPWSVFLMGSFAAFASIGTLVFFIFIFKAKKNIDKLTAELGHLKYHCFH